MISDESVQQLFKQSFSTLSRNDILADGERPTQVFRGITSKNWENDPHPGSCQRHMSVFKTFNIIPEYCFSCYKISIVPRTVVELFKLLMVFVNLDLKNDNTRKCMIETRPEISGAYKGYIYCQSLDEANEILSMVQPLISEGISGSVSVSIKRGCSEYSVAYPEYANIGDNAESMMSFRPEWHEFENIADNQPNQPPSMTVDSHNHSGYNLTDTLAMCTWLMYASTIGDESYLKISGSPVPPNPQLKRPPFKPV